MAVAHRNCSERTPTNKGFSVTLGFGGCRTNDELLRSNPTCPVSRVISMGRRNTKLELACIENKSQNSLLRLDEQEHCSGWVLTEYMQTDGPAAQALPNQCTVWCCNDRLSPHALPDNWILPTTRT